MVVPVSDRVMAPPVPPAPPTPPTPRSGVPPVPPWPPIPLTLIPKVDEPVIDIVVSDDAVMLVA